MYQGVLDRTGVTWLVVTVPRQTPPPSGTRIVRTYADLGDFIRSLTPDDEYVQEHHGLLDELVASIQVTQAAQERVQSIVNQLIADGVTWRTIAEAVGITPQAAHARWSSKGQERNRENQRRRRQTS